MNDKDEAIEKCLRQNGVIAYPTEAVWGLGCLPSSESAVRKILKMKDRSWEKGLILVATDIEQIRPYIHQSYLMMLRERLDSQLKAKKVEYAAITYLVPKSDTAPSWITGKSEKIAIRISEHPVIKKWCNRLNSSLISTSANLSGQAAAMNQAEVERYFPDGLDGVCSGSLGEQTSVSQIVDLESGDFIRGGSLTNDAFSGKTK